MWATSLEKNMNINFCKISVAMFVVPAIKHLLINLDSRGRSRDPEEALGVQALLLNVTDELGGTEKDSDPSENASTQGLWCLTFCSMNGTLVPGIRFWS